MKSLDEWEDVMKCLNRWARSIRAVARTMTVLVLAVIVVGISITPVFADRDDRGRGRDGYYGRRGYERHGRHYGPRGYYYPAPVYVAPPPVVYAPPPPPPGITFVFPLHIR